jgi:hypothetical protein
VDYNLLDEKWIPVLWKDGRCDRVGIIEALTQAHRIRQIAASNPMDRVAILRFLLALLYWCQGSPPDGQDTASFFPADWFKKLGDNRDCFNLLGDGKRFYQHIASGTEAKLSADYLVQEVPTGTNSWHFRHSTDMKDGLCADCCAMGLLRLPVFATSGGRGKPPGINQKPPVYVIPVGASLAETLRLSWRKLSGADLGTPVWERPDATLPKQGTVPLLMGLTWLPRRVWLDNPQEPQAICVSCGRKELLIRRCVFAGVGSTKTDGDGKGRVWADPHTISDGEDIVKPSSALARADAAAGQWTNIAAGILNAKKGHPKRSLWVVAFSTVQNDKYIEAMECEIPFPDTLEGGKVQESLENIERWQKECWKLTRKATPREASRKHVEIPPIFDAIRPHVEARVSGKAGELISAWGGAWEEAAREYSPMMAAVAKSLSPGVTTAALLRRRQLGYVKPDMREKTEAAEKTRRRKGGSSDSDGAIHPSPGTPEIW